MYNTFRIGIVCEYIDHKLNLEYIYRKRKQVTAYWKQEELEKMKNQNIEQSGKPEKSETTIPFENNRQKTKSPRL